MRRLLFPLLLLASCSPDQERIVQAKVEEKIKDFVKKKQLECRSSLLYEAEKKVDSMLLAEARLELQDSLNRTKPIPPAEPPIVPPLDSLEIKPIFEKQN
jgi:hypothetical protein